MPSWNALRPHWSDHLRTQFHVENDVFSSFHAMPGAAAQATS